MNIYDIFSVTLLTVSADGLALLGARISAGPVIQWYLHCIKTLRPRQNGHHFPDDIFKYIFLNENVWISHKISLKFVPNVRINNIPSLVQIIAWRRIGDKPLFEPMIDNVFDAYMCHSASMSWHWGIPSINALGTPRSCTESTAYIYIYIYGCTHPCWCDSAVLT